MAPNQPIKIRDFNEIPSDFFEKNANIILDLFEKACDMFIFKFDGEVGILASSMDWFMEEWGRDTFISLPGLLLSRWRYEDAKKIILRWARYERKGLIPTTIKNNISYYLDADSSLWFIRALKKYFEYTKDIEILHEVKYIVKDILYGYIYGTSYRDGEKIKHIYMDDDFLIVTPERATWMDASALGALPPITPRNGKAIEINALFYDALLFAIQIEKITSYEFHIDLEYYVRGIRNAFLKRFWDKERGIFRDVIDGDPKGNAFRPNQLFALYSEKLIPLDIANIAFCNIEKALLTPGGIRTLSPDDPDYHGKYDTYAPIEIKDLAYHNGTAWPWLMGIFCDVYFKIKSEEKNEEEIKNRMRYYVAPLINFLIESPYHSLPELFSGDPPHDPGGTRSQAWSVGEIYRIIKEYKLLNK